MIFVIDQKIVDREEEQKGQVIFDFLPPAQSGRREGNQRKHGLSLGCGN